MPTITINGERRSFPPPLTVSQLLEALSQTRRPVAVEVNQEVVPAAQHPQRRLDEGDAVEVVTLVGGGRRDAVPEEKPLVTGKFRFGSRLFTGTGKYTTSDLMRDCLAASGCEVTTVAV